MTHAQTLTRALGGKWHGRYGLAFCPAHDNRRTPALSLANGADNRLLITCFAGCSFREIMTSLRERRLIDGRGSLVPVDLLDNARQRTEEKAHNKRKAARAHGLWQEARPITGTLGEQYLRTRAITCDLPPALRFHRDCWHGATAQRMPAMVALVEGAKDLAVHRTYLSADGRKADVVPTKAMLGPCAGGAVRLSEGPGPLVLAEGIETALSLLCGLLPGPAPVWAALSTSGMRALNLPQQPGRLIVAPDGDNPGRAAAHTLASRATYLGWRVSLLPVPEDHDWNDVLRGKAGS